MDIIMCPFKVHIITNIESKLRTSGHIKAGRFADAQRQAGIDWHKEIFLLD